MKKKGLKKIDGLGPKNVAQIRKALRQVWSWSRARRLCIKRCEIKHKTLGAAFRCELCKKVCSKIFVDHIERCGDVDEGYIKRLFVPSKYLQGLCKKCHDKKTREERQYDKLANPGYFF